MECFIGIRDGREMVVNVDAEHGELEGCGSMNRIR